MTKPILALPFVLASIACRPEPTENPTTDTAPTTATPTTDAPTTDTPTSDTSTEPGDAPKQGEACPAGTCAEGLQCIEYFGIAGPNGPKFTSCEVPCPDEKSTCPEGQSCVTIADGPGRVCRPPA